MSIIDKMKKAHPAYWVLGLGGAALAIDYFVEKDRSVASSIYRKFFRGAGGGMDADEGEEGARSFYRRAPGVSVIPGSLYQTSRVYYPAYPSVHPHHHWMRRGPIFDQGHDWFGSHHGRGYGSHGREYGAFGHNHVR